MLEKTFYHATIRRTLLAFASLFREIVIERAGTDGTVINSIIVPLSFTDKEKFVARANEITYPGSDEPLVKETLPRLGINLMSVLYAPERKTHSLNRITSDDGSTWTFNRVPYDFQFGLYIGTRQIEDSLQIIEQILPFFTPDYTVKYTPVAKFNTHFVDLPIVLNSANPQIESGGTMVDDERRTVLWDLNFTAKGYLYGAVQDSNVIKKTVITFGEIPAFQPGEDTIVGEIVPDTAWLNDVYTTSVRVE